MVRKFSLAIVLLLLYVIPAVAGGNPQINGLNSTELPLSGRLVIEGAGFGVGGEVFIGGLKAWTTTWTDSRVVAYVPEEAPLGEQPVYLLAQGIPSNQLAITVTARPPADRVRWTFETDGANLWWRPAIAPDGTIFVHSNNTTDGLVYALSPNGGLLWIQKVNWYPYVPPSAGPDGEVYVGSINSIYRISAKGEIEWQFSDPGSPSIKTAPTIGPDGLLYGAYDVGIGAFALDPSTGQLIWSNNGDPFMLDKAGDGSEMVFGSLGVNQPAEQLYIHMDGGAGFYAFSLDGSQLFTTSFDGVRRAIEPVVGSDGTIYGPRYLGLRIAAVDPTDGSTLWEYNPGWASGTANVEIGPDDRLYFVAGGGGILEALNTSRQSRIWQIIPGFSMGRPTISPDGSVLVVSALTSGFEPGSIKGLNPKNGKELWSITLAGETYPGLRTHGVHHARITADSSTAYISTYTLSEDPTDPHAFLYAIDLDFEGGGGGGKGGGKGGGNGGGKRP